MLQVKTATTNTTNTVTVFRIPAFCASFVTVVIGLLFHLGRSSKGVVGRGRRHGPFQSFRVLPDFGARLLAAADGFDHHDQQDELRESEHESADTGDDVELRKLQGVIGNTPRHSGKAQEVLREEGHIKGDDGQPEMPFAECLVIHMAGPLGQPVVNAGKHTQH